MDHSYAWSVITRSILTFFHFHFSIYDLHQNSHNVCSDTISIGGVSELLRFSYRNLKAFVGGRGWNQKSFFSLTTLVNARFFIYNVDIGGASVDEDNDMQISAYGSSIIIIRRFYPGVDKKYWSFYCLGRCVDACWFLIFTSIGGASPHTHGTHSRIH